jgi:hypothetical protein
VLHSNFPHTLASLICDSLFRYSFIHIYAICFIIHVILISRGSCGFNMAKWSFHFNVPLGAFPFPHCMNFMLHSLQFYQNLLNDFFSQWTKKLSLTSSWSSCGRRDWKILSRERDEKIEINVQSAWIYCSIDENT